ncbi:MAG: VWA domain-containing protein [Candidatus Hydrogenedentes bacterium]|nr:VWA domain-containing protein [Candidatus Hydrogenedentota bacterium]
MLSRKTIFGVCLIATILLHLLLLIVAPRIVVFASQQRAPGAYDLFRVNLDGGQATQARLAPAPGGNALTSRPGEIQDMLNREPEQLTPSDDLLEAPEQVQGLEERATTEAPDRQYALEEDPAALKRVDARIIEIAQEDARQDIEVVRRLVRPSSSRILEPGELPTLRGPSLPDEPPALRFDNAGRSLLAEPIQEAEGPLLGGQPEPLIQTPGFQPAEGPGGVPQLQSEEAVVSSPDVAEVRRQQEESFTFLDDLLDIQVESYLPSGESLGYFRLRILPRAAARLDPLSKEVTFVVDASRSIMQRKLDLAARGISDALGALRPGDRFNVVVFRDTPSFFKSESVPVSDQNIADARAYVSNLEARGETNVYEALRPVVLAPAPEGMPKVVLIFTDGRPTTGMRDGRAIINALTADNRNSSIFAYAGGNTVNRYMLDLLAYRNKGASYVTDDLSEIDDNLPRFFETMDEPLLIDLQSSYGRVDDTQIFPQRLPDFYKDRPITIYGRYVPGQEKDFVLRLTGEAAGREKEVIFRADLSKAASGDATIARNWAFQKAYYIIGEISRLGEQPDLMRQLRQLEDQYAIKTSYSE